VHLQYEEINLCEEGRAEAKANARPQSQPGSLQLRSQLEQHEEDQRRRLLEGAGP